MRPLPRRPADGELNLPGRRRPRIPSGQAQIPTPAQPRPPRELAGAIHDGGVPGRQAVEVGGPAADVEARGDLVEGRLRPEAEAAAEDDEEADEEEEWGEEKEGPEGEGAVGGLG